MYMHGLRWADGLRAPRRRRLRVRVRAATYTHGDQYVYVRKVYECMLHTCGVWSVECGVEREV